ncbi:MAG TPA: MerR family transcriptional regulator [Acidobacteriaceae bacterium]
MFRIQQFAALANVTVRTLHHYDRLGLLKPAHRSASGYRLYRNEDLGQLERIIVLRYLGLPLREIAGLLATGGPDSEHSLPSTLARQAAVLRERRAGIDRVLKAIERAQRQWQKNGDPDWFLYQTILKEIHMQESQNWTEKYYNAEARQAIDERRSEWNPEMQAKITADWQQMYADVQAAMDRGVKPTSDEGKALAARWMTLVSGFTGGKPEVLEGLNTLYADRTNWPKEQVSEEMKANLPKPELMAFIRAAQAKA